MSSIPKKTLNSRTTINDVLVLVVYSCVAVLTISTSSGNRIDSTVLNLCI